MKRKSLGVQGVRLNSRESMTWRNMQGNFGTHHKNEK